jgi:ABC-2 type transport system ATP-binding protein
MKRALSLSIVALAVSAARLATAATDCTDPGAAYDCTRTDAMVTVDPLLGIALEASLYVPNAPVPSGGFPLIVRQHGGGSNKDNGYDTLYARKAVETGNYAALMYSHRGHGKSGGIFDFFGPESIADFSKMLDWVESVAGPTVDTDDVGTSGYSQGGGMSLLPAEHDARVKAVAVGNTFDSLNRALKPNGCYKFSWANGIFLAAYKATLSKTDDVTAARWGLAMTSDTERTAVPPFPSAYDEMAAHSPGKYVANLYATPFTDEQLRTRSTVVPVFWSNSWEDQLFPADHPKAMLDALEAHGVPIHYWFASGGHAAGPNDPDDEAAKETAIVRWFDRWLRGVAVGDFDHQVDFAERVPGSDPADWTIKSATDWPIPGTTATVFHPHADGSLHPDPEPGADAGVVLNDLANVNVKNDAILNEIARNFPGMGDVVQSVPESGTPLDTRLYVSGILGADLEFVGAPVLDLAVASTAVDRFQVSAKLFDLAPDGSARMVGRSCTSLPAGTTSAALELWPNAHVFAIDHRIALAISAVDFPVFKPDREPQATTILPDTALILPTIP